MRNIRIAVIGGGAAGFFAAINAAEKVPQCSITIYEKTDKILAKVKISGGGRCNLTNACFDPRQLVNFYPRGSKELLGAFFRFQPRDTIEWFQSRNVDLKIETDGRVFPVSNSSQTIIDCFSKSAESALIKVETGHVLREIITPDFGKSGYQLLFGNGSQVDADIIIIAAGGSKEIWSMLTGMGIKVIPPVPSLFSFRAFDNAMSGLSGIAVPDAEITVEGSKFSRRGPLLITHEGFSGPAVLQLSSAAARWLADARYNFNLIINWTAGNNAESIFSKLISAKNSFSGKTIESTPLFGLPTRLWKHLLEQTKQPIEIRWRQASNSSLHSFAQLLASTRARISGRAVNKDEFVSCGGIKLSEIDFKTMQSKSYCRLFFAGEILDIDGLTGGYNFQAAWTTAYIAAAAIANTAQGRTD